MRVFIAHRDVVEMRHDVDDGRTVGCCLTRVAATLRLRYCHVGVVSLSMLRLAGQETSCLLVGVVGM